MNILKKSKALTFSLGLIASIIATSAPSASAQNEIIHVNSGRDKVYYRPGGIGDRKVLLKGVHLNFGDVIELSPRSFVKAACASGGYGI
ncbi:MAG: hypothetical protein AAGA18_15585 [Verrucomicrobiota bacterium]